MPRIDFLGLRSRFLCAEIFFSGLGLASYARKVVLLGLGYSLPVPREIFRGLGLASCAQKRVSGSAPRFFCSQIVSVAWVQFEVRFVVRSLLLGVVFASCAQERFYRDWASLPLTSGARVSFRMGVQLGYPSLSPANVLFWGLVFSLPTSQSS